MLVIIALIINGGFAWVCSSLAKDRGKDPAVWALLGFFFTLVALIILVVSSKSALSADAMGGADCPKCKSAQVEQLSDEHYRCFNCDHAWTEEPLSL